MPPRAAYKGKETKRGNPKAKSQHRSVRAHATGLIPARNMCVLRPHNGTRPRTVSGKIQHAE